MNKNLIQVKKLVPSEWELSVEDRNIVEYYRTILDNIAIKNNNFKNKIYIQIAQEISKNNVKTISKDIIKSVTSYYKLNANTIHNFKDPNCYQHVQNLCYNNSLIAIQAISEKNWI